MRGPDGQLLEEQKLLRDALSEASTDESLCSIVAGCHMLQRLLGEEATRKVVGMLHCDQDRIASLEAKGVSV